MEKKIITIAAIIFSTAVITYLTFALVENGVLIGWVAGSVLGLAVHENLFS